MLKGKGKGLGFKGHGSKGKGKGFHHHGNPLSPVLGLAMGAAAGSVLAQAVVATSGGRRRRPPLRRPVAVPVPVYLPGAAPVAQQPTYAPQLGYPVHQAPMQQAQPTYAPQMGYPVHQAPIQQPIGSPMGQPSVQQALAAQHAVPAELPLAIGALHIPAGAIQQGDGVTYFGVDVAPLGELRQWRVMRRYNNFFDLEKTLNSLVSGVTFPGSPFPGKQWGKLSGAALEARRRGLESWLRSVVAHPASGGIWAAVLRSFLQNGSVERQASSPSAPPDPLQAGRLQGQELQLQMPAGVVAGQFITVTVPDGRQLPFVVPDGVQSPGSVIRVWFDPLSGSLSAMGDADLAEGPSSLVDGGGTGEVVQITVPAGVSGGQVLAVTVPDGRQVTFTLPPHAAPGCALELWYDSQTGTLTPLD